ncbi:MAG: hypothetical protein AB1679_24100 [Actinomycetota bacterium]
MMVRARIAVFIVSALAVLVLLSGQASPADEVHPAVRSAAISATHVVGKVPVSGVSDRAPRLVSTPVRLSHLSAMPLISALVCLGVTGRFRRRITDAGHDWRSLLVGAPPSLR